MGKVSRKTPEKQKGTDIRVSEADKKAASNLGVTIDQLSQVRLPSFGDIDDDLDDGWDEDDDSGEVTLVAELPDEIKALQKGFRKVDPLAGGTGGDSRDADAEIEVVGEEFFEPLLVEELLDDSPTGEFALLKFEAAAKSDIGKVRKVNEDAHLIDERNWVYIVADGMGGHAGGQVASKLAVDRVVEAFGTGNFGGKPNFLWPRRGDELARSFELANEAVYTKSVEDPVLAGMGTTMVGVRFSPHRKRAYVAHVGDSRCYRIRDGEMMALTKDHTLGVEFGLAGRLAERLSRAVGIADNVEVDLKVDAVEAGDKYLICCDGLYKMLDEDAILKVVLSDDPLQQRVDRLVEAANEAGGRDNITVILIEVEDMFPEKTS